MTLRLVEIAVVMYVVNVALLWMAARMIAPAESRPSVWRCLGAAVLMTFFGNASNKFLYPFIGPWDILVKLVLYVLAAMAVLKLAWWRSSLLALIFYAGLLAEAFFWLEIQ
jgi:hypothetical protein